MDIKTNIFNLLVETVIQQEFSRLYLKDFESGLQPQLIQVPAGLRSCTVQGGTKEKRTAVCPVSVAHLIIQNTTKQLPCKQGNSHNASVFPPVAVSRRTRNTATQRHHSLDGGACMEVFRVLIEVKMLSQCRRVATPE